MKRLYKTRTRWLGLFSRNFGHYCENSGSFRVYNNYSTVFYDIRIEITRVKQDYYRVIFSRNGFKIYIEYRFGEISEYSDQKSSVLVLGDLIKVLRCKEGYGS